MTERTEYAVLRFVDKNGYCHMINDYVKGSSLAQYLREHPQTDKAVFWGWLEKISALAVQYYKWKDGECYGYFNPYAMILTEEDGLVFLDTKDEENEELIGFMQKKSVRTLFMRPERVLSLKITFDDDMYSLGKTIQFLAAKCKTVPGFTRKEEKSLRRLITKCMDKREKNLKDLKEVHRELKSLNDTEGNVPGRGKKGKRVLCAAAVISAAVAVIVAVRGENKVQTARAQHKKQASETVQAGEDLNEKERDVWAQVELGLLYLTELEDKAQSRSCFEKISEECRLADIYLKIIHYISRDKNGAYVGRELEQALQAGAKELEKIEAEAWWNEKQVLYQMPFVQAYGLVNTEAAAEASISICKELLEHDVWKDKEGGKERELELRSYLAAAYEKTDENQLAIEEYEIVKELEEDDIALEQIYLKLERLYERTEQKEKIWQVLKEATEKLPQSSQVWTRYLRQCCADTGIEREACAEYVRNAITSAPDIKENEEFLKLQKEYDITVEGENICVGR